MSSDNQSSNTGCLWMGGLFFFLMCLGAIGVNSSGNRSRSPNDYEPVRSPGHSRLRELGLSDAEIEYHKRNPNMRGWSDADKEQLIEEAVKLDCVLEQHGY